MMFDLGSFRQVPGPEVGEISETKIPVSNPPGEMRLRIYKPTPKQAKEDAKAAAGQSPPVYINYHGGGAFWRPAAALPLIRTSVLMYCLQAGSLETSVMTTLFCVTS
jgi:hypothetical protein